MIIGFWILHIFLMWQLDQLLRYDLIRHFYTELHQSDLDTLILDKTSFNSVETFISSCCDNLISIQHNGEPHLVSRDGTFLQKYLRRAIQESFDKNNFCTFLWRRVPISKPLKTSHLFYFRFFHDKATFLMILIETIDWMRSVLFRPKLINSNIFVQKLITAASIRCYTNVWKIVITSQCPGRSFQIFSKHLMDTSRSWTLTCCWHSALAWSWSTMTQVSTMINCWVSLITTLLAMKSLKWFREEEVFSC